MAHAPVHIKLDPNRCDRCGKCVRVCEPAALKVAPTYLYLDWRACDECMKCIDACDRGAITPLAASRRGRTGHPKPQARVKTAPADTARASSGGVTPVAAQSRKRTSAHAASTPTIAAASGAFTGWGIAEAAAALAVAFAALFASEAIMGLDALTGMPAQGRILARVVVLGGFYAVQFALLAFLAHRRGVSLSRAFGLTRVHARLGSWLAAAGWVALLLVTTRLAAWVWGIASRAVGFDPPSVAEGGFEQLFGAGIPGLVLSVLLVVVVAPIAEEMVFRGVVLGALGARWGATVGLLGSAAIFALYHLTAWQIAPVFILGIACGWLTQHRGSLWPAIVLHALYNAVPVAAAFYVVR